ncbi:TPA: hypothetical protein ACMDQ8_003153 [Vibrio parahaemolyticus]|nr:hypothetical protein [Vibrio parahaemolyticus]EME0833778.1 hypothetical protein [Vibrio parahaemolyticus]
MNTIKYVTTPLRVESGAVSFIHIIVDDMNRFIYQSDDKVFSIRSPFNVMEKDGELSFYTPHIAEINSAVSSRVIALLSDDRFDSPNSLDFLEAIEEAFCSDVDETWAFILDLMSFEDGYLRFDHDPDNEDGRLHPLTHLDICYTTASTYKIGTYLKPCVHYLTKLLQVNDESLYLENKK